MNISHDSPRSREPISRYRQINADLFARTSLGHLIIKGGVKPNPVKLYLALFPSEGAKGLQIFK